MKAEIVAVGTELLLGQIANTNARWMSEQLADVGVDVLHHQTVGDNVDRVAEVLALAASRADVVLVTGGLGPTQDDMTREAIAPRGWGPARAASGAGGDAPREVPGLLGPVDAGEQPPAGRRPGGRPRRRARTRHGAGARRRAPGRGAALRDGRRAAGDGRDDGGDDPAGARDAHRGGDRLPRPARHRDRGVGGRRGARGPLRRLDEPHRGVPGDRRRGEGPADGEGGDAGGSRTTHRAAGRRGRGAARGRRLLDARRDPRGNRAAAPRRARLHDLHRGVVDGRERERAPDRRAGRLGGRRRRGRRVLGRGQAGRAWGRAGDARGRWGRERSVRAGDGRRRQAPAPRGRVPRADGGRGAGAPRG